MWQVANYGPMLGQANHFNRYATEPVPYGSWRYTSECRRLNSVLDKQLIPLISHYSKVYDNANQYISTLQFTTLFTAGDRMTIADFAIFIFAHSNKWCGVDITQSSNLKAWHDKLAQRPAFQKSLHIPIAYQFSDEAVVDPEKQEYYQMIRKYGSQGIKASTDQWPGENVPVPSDHANLLDGGSSST